MTPSDPKITLARRELVLVAVILVVVTRLVERPDAFLVAGLLPVVMLLAGSAVLRTGERPGRPFESLLIPAVLTGGTAAALHLVPPGLALVPALLAFAFGLDRILALELRILAQVIGDHGRRPRADPGRGGRHRVRRVHGRRGAGPGRARRSPGPRTPGPALTEAWLLVLALDDALIALILGYRVAVGALRELAATRSGRPRPTRS